MGQLPMRRRIAISAAASALALGFLAAILLGGLGGAGKPGKVSATLEAPPSPSATQVPSPSPSATQAPSPSQSAAPAPPASQDPAVQVTGKLDPAKLPRGAAPKTVWTAGDGLLHDGVRQVRLPAGEVAQLAKTAHGYAALIRIPNDSEVITRLWLIAPDGDETELGKGGIHGFAISPDGSRIAWAYSVSPALSADPPSTLKLADVRSGQVLHELPTDWGYAAKGFTGDRVVFERLAWEDDGQIWDPATGTLSTFREGARIGFVDAPSGLATVFAPVSDFDVCFSLIRSAAPADDLWRSCKIGPLAIAPGAEWVLADDSYRDGLGPVQLYVAAAADGTVRSKLTSEVFGDVAWEDESHFLAVAHNDTQGAIVRCSIDMYCERASGLAPWKDPGTELAPFRLAR